MTVNLRAEAARALVAVLQHGRSLKDALPAVSPPLQKELVYGVVRWYWRLEEHAQKLLDSPVRKRDADIMALILIGLYQLSELRLPAHAAINETVAGCEQVRVLPAWQDPQHIVGHRFVGKIDVAKLHGEQLTAS